MSSCSPPWPWAPVLFVSHGAPTFAVEPGKLGAELRALGARLSSCSAVLVVSAHWQTPESACPIVMTHATPPTIHDFGGFSPALYQLQYPARGHPALAERAAQCLADAGFSSRLDKERGLDHGAWVPSMHLFPDATIPMFQVSLPFDLTPQEAVSLGHALAPLRQEGVLILASGSVTHNLHQVQHVTAPPHPKAVEFAQWVRQHVLRNDVHGLVQFQSLAPHANWAHPTLEHYLPLLVAMGAVDSCSNGEGVQAIDGGFTYGVLSMDSYLWTVPER